MLVILIVLFSFDRRLRRIEQALSYLKGEFNGHLGQKRKVLLG